MAYDSKEDELAAYLLANGTVFEQLCLSLLSAGEQAQKSLEDNPVLYNLTALPLAKDGVTREIKPFFINSTLIKIQYDWKDITIVGGAAFNAIEMTSQVDMDLHINTHTTDIDAVWWPTVIGKNYIPAAIQNAPVYPAVDAHRVLQHHFADNLSTSFDPRLRKQRQYGITSLSPAIVTLANTYANHLAAISNYSLQNPAFMGAIQKCFTDHGYPFDPHQVRFSVETTSALPLQETDTAAEKVAKRRRIRGSILSGSWSITGYLELLHLPMRLKLIDVSIHDDCSSQRSAYLQDSMEDLLYLNTKVANSQLRIPLPQKGPTVTHVPIPTLDKLFSQQRYALANRTLLWETGSGISHKKVQAHHRRLQYLLDFVEYIYSHGQYLFIQTLLEVFQLGKYPPFFHKLKQTELRESKEWMASCPLYLPAFPPCSETETDPSKIRDCALHKCKIDAANPAFLKLCETGKVMEPFLCSKKGGTRKKRYASSSKSRL